MEAFELALTAKTIEVVKTAKHETSMTEWRQAKRMLKFLSLPDSPLKRRKLIKMERHARAELEDGTSEGDFTIPVGAMDPSGAINWEVVFSVIRVFLSILGLLLLFII